MAEAIAGATEHQGEGTPHFHGQIALITPFQHKTLQDIADLIQRDFRNLDMIKSSVGHLCREDHFDHEGHEARLDSLEADWEQNFNGPEHNSLCAKPGFFYQPVEHSLWRSS